MYTPTTHLRATGMEDKRYTMHSFRVEGADIAGTTMDVLTEYARWKSAAVARRYVGVTTYAAAAGMKRCREAASTAAGALPLSEQYARSYRAFPRAN